MPPFAPQRFAQVLRENRPAILVWLIALILYALVVFVISAMLLAGPVSPEAAAEARAFRQDYLSPWHLFSSSILAPIIETWLVVKGMDALASVRWRGPRAVVTAALVAGVMHYFARGAFSALYNACFFALMARIYDSSALGPEVAQEMRDEIRGEIRGDNRPATIAVLFLMHIINNGVALGMIGIYARSP